MSGSRPPSGLVAWVAGKWGLSDGQLRLVSQLAMLTALGLILMIGSSVLMPRKPAGEPTGPATLVGGTARVDGQRALGNAIALDLERMLGQVAGAGRVSVTVELEAGNEQIVAVTSDDSRRTTEEQDTTGGKRTVTETDSRSQPTLVGSGQAPIVLKEVGPRIRGVLVVAEGAWDARVKYALWRAVQTSLGVPAHIVQVMPRGR